MRPRADAVLSGSGVMLLHAAADARATDSSFQFRDSRAEVAGATTGISQSSRTFFLVTKPRSDVSSLRNATLEGDLFHFCGLYCGEGLIVPIARHIILLLGATWTTDSTHSVSYL